MISEREKQKFQETILTEASSHNLNIFYPYITYFKNPGCIQVSSFFPPTNGLQKRIGVEELGVVVVVEIKADKNQKKRKLFLFAMRANDSS